MMKKVYSFLLLLFLAQVSMGADITVTAAASKNQVATGEEFEITFSINSGSDQFSPPDFRGFQILSGPNQSSSMTSINGNMSQSSSFSYDLVAIKEGEYTIGPATLSVNGHEYKTNTVKIKVVKGKPVPANQQNQNTGANDPDDQVAPLATSSNISKHLFIRAIPDKPSAYQGEQVSLTYRLYCDVGLVGSQLDKLPDYNGFWNQEIKAPNQNVEWKIETYKGTQYHTADIKQIILFPQRSGTIPIEPMEMTFVVRQAVPAKTFMEQFMGAFKDAKYQVKSNILGIHVKPLPENGKPLGFSGAVGRFTLRASLDKNSVKANESLDYKLQISGSGNLKLIPPPMLNLPSDIEKYDPKTIDSISETFKGVSGRREYTYLLIPRHEGSYKLPPYQFSYFDPQKGEYVNLESKAFPIEVLKGVGTANSAVYSASAQQDIKDLGKDIRYIRTNDPHLYSEDEGFFGSGAYLALFTSAPAFFLLALAFRKKNRELNANTDLIRQKKAAQIAARHLAIAEKELNGGRQKEFYESISKGLYGYISDKLNIPTSDLNRENISSKLLMKGLDKDLIGSVIDTLDLCEMARFAPPSGISQNEIFEKSKKLIYDIENKL